MNHSLFNRVFCDDFYAIKHKGTKMCHGVAYFFFEVTLLLFWMMEG